MLAKVEHDARLGNFVSLKRARGGFFIVWNANCFADPRGFARGHAKRDKAFSAGRIHGRFELDLITGAGCFIRANNDEPLPRSSWFPQRYALFYPANFPRANTWPVCTVNYTKVFSCSRHRKPRFITLAALGIIPSVRHDSAIVDTISAIRSTPPTSNFFFCFSLSLSLSLSLCLSEVSSLVHSSRSFLVQPSESYARNFRIQVLSQRQISPVRRVFPIFILLPCFKIH